MKKHISLRFISFLISLIIILGGFPVSALSLGANKNIDDASEYLKEDISLRDKFTKHYIDTDGSRYAVVFPEQVHYQKDSEWLDVDNSLSLDSKGERYISKNDVFKAGFSKNSNDSQLVSIEEDGYKISWSITFTSENSSPVMSAFANANAKRIDSRAGVLDSVEYNGLGKTKDNMTHMGKTMSGIRYNGVFNESVDIRYSVLHGKVEEDVILNSPHALTSYTLTVNTNELTAVGREDGSVRFINSDGETVFNLDAPWMTDAAFAVSHDIAVEVVQEDSTAYITYTPDAEWLNDTSRLYPVLIDPSFTSRTYTSNYEDTCVYSGDYPGACVDLTKLTVGTFEDTEHYAYIRVLDIPEFFFDYYSWCIQGVALELTLSSPSLSAAPALNLYKVTEEWDIDEICYDNQPDSDLRKSNVGAQRLLSRNGYSFDLSNWIEGYEDEVDTLEEYRDYGFMIECSEDGYAQLHSSENSHARYMPVFVIEYSYYHDDSLEDGAVYSFKNSASNKYMTVYSGGTAEGTNVCQSYSATPTLSQTFRLDYDEDCECFRIRSLCSSNGYGSALTYSYSFMTNNPTDSTSRNVYLYSIDEEDSAWEDDQAWMIVQHNYTDLYKIVSKKNPDLAVTVCGTASGTSGGNTATSAGNIFVSEFTGAANQLWKIESGGIQLNNGENIKTVTAKDYVSEENNLGQFFCPVTEFGETVAWSSNNIRSVAVEPNGNVTTVKAGIANITATVTHANGTTTAHSCTIYVVIENGVYCFNNVESGYRIEYQSSSDYSDGAILEVYDNGDEDEESDVPTYALFKIKYLGSGRYSIRSMLRSDMGWCSLDNFSELTMLNIGTDDSDIPSYAKWFISYSENGYYIYTYQTRTVTSSTESGDHVTTSNYNPNNPNPLYQWNLTKVTTECNGITIYRQPNTIVVGRSNTYEASVYSSNTNINGQNGISWSVSGITGSATINSETGVLTGQSPGTVIVTATYTHSASQQWSNSCTVTVVPISNGVYYFKNAKFTGHNMQIDNNAGSSDNGAIMELWDRDGGYDQRWIITHVGDEYYKIVSSISNKALTAPSSADGMLTQTDYTQATTQQWKITIVGDGTYKLSPKSNESFYMSAGDGIITADGRNIRMRAAQSDNKDEWYIEQLYSTVFYGIESEGHDHESALSTVKNEMLEYSDDNQYWHGITLRTGEVTASVCKNDLKTANIFAIRTHGMESDESGTVITLNQANNTTSVTYFASHWIPEMITTNNSQSITITDDFSNVTLALFICCESGAGGEGGDNLPTRIVEYGAKAAVGFTKSIDCGAANTWTASFYEFLLAGDTLEDAASKAWEYVRAGFVQYEYDEENEEQEIYPSGFDGESYDEDIIICGDKTLVLP